MSTTSPVKPPPAQRSGSSRSRQALWRGTLGVALLIAVLEATSRAGLVDSRFLPPFSEVVVKSVLVWAEADFREDMAATLTTYLLGTAIAAAIGIPLGVLLGLSEPSYRATRTAIELIRPVPPVALIPLVLLLFGNGLQMKLIIVVFAAVWPILFNTIYGVHDVDPKAREMAVSFGQKRVAVIRRVVLPSAAPFVMTGIRVSSAIALIVTITVELLAGGTSGLGAFIARERATGDDVALVYAGTLFAGVLGLAINLILAASERRFFGWSTAGRNV